MDIRHPLQKYDWQIIRWASESKMPIHLLLTKSDKLTRGAINNVLLSVEEELAKEKLEKLKLKREIEELKTQIKELDDVDK